MWSHLQGSRCKTAWPLKMGLIGCPETLVRNYHSALSKILKEHGSHLAHCCLRYLEIFQWRSLCILYLCCIGVLIKICILVYLHAFCCCSNTVIYVNIPFCWIWRWVSLERCNVWISVAGLLASSFWTSTGLYWSTLTFLQTFVVHVRMEKLVSEAG
jgi:hypothetical protein